MVPIRVPYWEMMIQVCVEISEDMVKSDIVSFTSPLHRHALGRGIQKKGDEMGARLYSSRTVKGAAGAAKNVGLALLAEERFMPEMGNNSNSTEAILCSTLQTPVMVHLLSRSSIFLEEMTSECARS